MFQVLVSSQIYYSLQPNLIIHFKDWTLIKLKKKKANPQVNPIQLTIWLACWVGELNFSTQFNLFGQVTRVEQLY